MLREHCHYSLDYSSDIKTAADPDNLTDTDRVVQFPFTAPGTYETPEEMAARMLEKKREQGRRLQAQAHAVREEKLQQREQDVAAYLAVRELKGQEKKADYMVLRDSARVESILTGY